jgi:hypothetical protein
VVAFPFPKVKLMPIFHKTADYKVSYAAASLISDQAPEVFVMIWSSEPIEGSLNDQMIVASQAHNAWVDGGDFRYIRRVHVKKGANSILVKSVCRSIWGGFIFRIATPDRAQQIVHHHVGLPDILKESVVAPGRALSLDDNLVLYAGQTGRPESIVKMMSFSDGRRVHESAVPLESPPDIPVSGLEPGLYKLRLETPNQVLTQPFSIGEPEALVFKVESEYRAVRYQGAVAAEIGALIERLHILLKPDFALLRTRMDWQKEPVYALSEIQSALASIKSHGFPWYLEPERTSRPSALTWMAWCSTTSSAFRKGTMALHKFLWSSTILSEACRRGRFSKVTTWPILSRSSSLRVWGMSSASPCSDQALAICDRNCRWPKRTWRKRLPPPSGTTDLTRAGSMRPPAARVEPAHKVTKPYGGTPPTASHPWKQRYEGMKVWRPVEPGLDEAEIAEGLPLID